MKKLLAVLALVAAAACTPKVHVGSPRPKVEVVSPIIIGAPGPVYQSVEAQVSVDVVNNSMAVGDILVGKTLIFEGFKPQEIENIGFECGGLVVVPSRQTVIRLAREGNRTEYVYFRPHDPAKYKMIQKEIKIDHCDLGEGRHRRRVGREKEQFQITSRALRR